MNRESIVAIGLLTQRDLDVPGKGFSRQYRIVNDDMFDALLRQLNEIEATPDKVDSPGSIHRLT